MFREVSRGFLFSLSLRAGSAILADDAGVFWGTVEADDAAVVAFGGVDVAVVAAVFWAGLVYEEEEG